jgi:hypothetical protein
MEEVGKRDFVDYRPQEWLSISETTIKWTIAEAKIRKNEYILF